MRMGIWFGWYQNAHGNVILTTFPLLVTPEVVMLRVSGEASDENFVKMTLPVSSALLVSEAAPDVWTLVFLYRIHNTILQHRCQHIAEKKWTPYHRRHFQMDFS